MLSERFRKTDLACFSINSKLYVTFGPVKLQSEQDFFPPPCFFFLKKKTTNNKTPNNTGSLMQNLKSRKLGNLEHMF